LTEGKGLILKGLIEAGGNVGVSSRGLGSIVADQQGRSIVQNDYRICTVDCVSAPSAPGAFVKGLLEGVEFAFDERTGEYLAQTQQTLRRMSSRQLGEYETQVRVFSDFLATLTT